jgi:hypothetical protein
MVTIRCVPHLRVITPVLTTIALGVAGQAAAATAYHQAAVRACTTSTCMIPFTKTPPDKQLRVEYVSCLLEQVAADAKVLWGQVSAAPTKNGVASSAEWLGAPAGAERSPDIVISQQTLFFVPPNEFPRLTVSLSGSFQSISCTITGYLLAPS